jgi:segregation and condensation protein A
MSGSQRRRALGPGPGATPTTALREPSQPTEPAEPPEAALDRTAPGGGDQHGTAGEPSQARTATVSLREPAGPPDDLHPDRPADGAAEQPGGPTAEHPADPVPAAEPTSATVPQPVSADPSDGAAERPGGPTAKQPSRPAPDPATGTSAAADEHAGDGRFRVVLENFEGPFDLLLQLISKHRLDVTEVALSRVTDDFMTHIRAMGPDFDLDQTTEFLVVAATLLDLKAARLLPAAQVEDEADLALLEARDLLFARLLQYRAYKRVADIFSGRLASEAHRHPRTVGLEPHHADLLPDVVISLGAEGFARLAVKAMQPKPKPQVYVDHIHAPLVSVQEQAEVVIARLRELGDASFADLVRDAPDTLTVVARFLALLELYRERAVSLDQEEALGPLTVRWRGPEDGRTLVTDEFDRQPETDAKTEEERR